MSPQNKEDGGNDNGRTKPRPFFQAIPGWGQCLAPTYGLGYMYKKKEIYHEEGGDDHFMLSDGEAATIAVTIQAVLTGAQLVTFISSLRLHIFPGDGSTIRKRIPWLIITILVMAFTIIDLAGTLKSRLLGLEGDSGQLPASVIVITYASKSSMAVALDGVLIYRCWVVYGKQWQIAVLPLVLLLYNFSCILVVIYLTAASGPKIKVIPFTEIYNNPEIDVIEAAFVIATIVINVYATSAIIYRIFRESMPGANSRLKPTFIFAIRVVAESGLIYTMASIALVCAIFVSDAGTPYPLLITAAIFTPIAGIAYNIIWIRVAQRRADRSSNVETVNLKTIVLEDSDTVEKEVHDSV